VFANPALAKTFGKSLDEIVGVDFAVHLDVESRARVAQHRAENSSTPRCYEVVLDGRAQSVLLVTETSLTEDESARRHSTNRTLRVMRDLTERIEAARKQHDLERQLQRGQALQSLSVLAGGVAHDFNNLLSGVVGNAEYALRRVPKSSPLELTQCIEEIREFANEASQLSRQMLAYAGRRGLAVVAADVNVEVREALRLIHSTVEAQALLCLELAAHLPTVRADRIQLRQVITNLVLNALEAMAPNRGTLTIRTQSSCLDDQQIAGLGAPEGFGAGQYVTIAVSDTGVGIPAELKDRILEPFFSTKSPGRGMGLAASVGIVRSHRGWLDVTSEVGKGSTFRILLPLGAGSEQPVRRLTPTNLGPVRTGSILLIDDEAAVRVVTNRLLSDLGQRVMTAPSGRRGLELYRQHHATIDLVVLDLTMPDLSGAEVLTELRQIRQDVAVVVTSGFHPSNATDLLKLPNVLGFLEKPHTSANLEAIVATLSLN
jgi:two-component system, cell cycle sensor histidine kinase and response regulator CckA